MNSNFIWCKFVSATIPGKWLSSTNVKCVTPPATIKEDMVTVGVIDNGAEYSSSDIMYYFKDPPTITSIYKKFGSHKSKLLI